MCVVGLNVIKLPGIKGDALFGSLAGTNTLSTGCPFTAVSPGMKVISIPSREVMGLNRLCRAGGIAPTAVRFISVTKLMGNTDGKRKLKGRFLTGVERISTVMRMIHYFRSAGVVRISNSVSPTHSVRAVGLRLVFSSVRVLSHEVTGVTGRTEVSGALTGRLRLIRTIGTRLRSNGVTEAFRMPSSSSTRV